MKKQSQLNDNGAPRTSDSGTPDDALIARRAYQRYEERGREDGHDQEDWFEAECQIRGTSSPSASRDDTRTD